MNSETLYRMLLADEGKRLDIYQCSLGYWTIGIGFLITKDPNIVNRAQAIACLDKMLGRKTQGRITDQECQRLYEQSISDILRTLPSYPELNKVYLKLDSVRQMAILNMCFQLGVNGVARFKKMLANLSRQQFELAAVEALNSNWHKQTPNRAKRVARVLETGRISHKDYQL